MYSKELEVAKAAVLKASELCVLVQRNLVTEHSISKRDKSPVTIADFGAQAVVSKYLRNHFSECAVMGEEDCNDLELEENSALKEAVIQHVQQVDPEFTSEDILHAISCCNFAGGAKGRFWTLDPIDGTKGFLRKDQYAVALALIEDGEIVLGVLGCPNLPERLDQADGPRGMLFSAVKGQGAQMESFDHRIQRNLTVSSIQDPSQAVFCESVESGHTAQNESQQVSERLGVNVPPARIDSQCKYSVVARGEASVYLRLPTRKDYEEKIWDHAAGCILVEEAGGRVTDIYGKALDFSQYKTLKNNKGVIASNGALHEAVLDSVQEVLALG